MTFPDRAKPDPQADLRASSAYEQGVACPRPWRVSELGHIVDANGYPVCCMIGPLVGGAEARALQARAMIVTAVNAWKRTDAIYSD